jgi:hypothetical protein
MQSTRIYIERLRGGRALIYDMFRALREYDGFMNRQPSPLAYAIHE